MNKKKPNNNRPEWPLNNEVIDRDFVKEKKPNILNKKETKKVK